VIGGNLTKLAEAAELSKRSRLNSRDRAKGMFEKTVKEQGKEELQRTR